MCAETCFAEDGRVTDRLYLSSKISDQSQEQLIQFKGEDIGAVQSTVKSGIKSWPDIVSKSESKKQLTSQSPFSFLPLVNLIGSAGSLSKAILLVVVTPVEHGVCMEFALAVV